MWHGKNGKICLLKDVLSQYVTTMCEYMLFFGLRI